MSGFDTNAVTTLVEASQRGDPLAADRLLPLVYDELRQRAAAHLGRQHPGQTLQPTALVHEAYMRLVGQGGVQWAGRTHLFAVASQMLRRVLIDHVRARKAAKRGGGRAAVTLDTGFEPADRTRFDAEELDDALQRLAAEDARAARVVEMRFFGGMTDADIAAELGVTDRTVRNDWSFAKAWLSRDLSNVACRP